MSNDFKTLVDFLDRFGPEVSGKALVAPQDEAAVKLQRFAVGACNEAERSEVCEMLRQHPAWLRWLADQVKRARSGAASTR